MVQHQAIERAIVVGVKHQRLGEVVAVFLQGTPQAVDGTLTPLSDNEVREWVKMRLGRHKAPEHVFWLGMDGISITVPLTGSGKVRKFELASLAEKLLTTPKAKL